MKQSTRDAWSEKFGIRILEGYGVTETAPVLALNTPMFNKAGTVGRIMPGVETKLDCARAREIQQIAHEPLQSFRLVAHNRAGGFDIAIGDEAIGHRFGITGDRRQGRS